MKILFAFIILLAVQDSTAQLTAFPGAEGYGKYASGGRGGAVAIVTNLDDSGEGSFRNALEQFPGQPLTIVFEVAGIIELKSKIQIKRSNLTIAGQTAPGKGICFKDQSLVLNGASSKGNHGNIIIRFIRSRPGGNLKTGLYGFNMENCHDVMVDHCSFSWANEECAAMYDTKNTTVQWCIVSEGLYEAGHQKGHRSYGGVWGGQYASYHHNLIAHQNSRAVRFNGARAHDTIALVDYRNNVIYNWGNENASYGGNVNIAGGVSQVNMIANYYKPGPAQPRELKFIYALHDKNESKGTGNWYLEDNVMDGNKRLTKYNSKGADFSHLPPLSVPLSDTPFAVMDIVSQDAVSAYEDVLKHAGAILPIRDNTDARVVKETAEGTASGMGVFGKPGIIDSPLAVGGWDDYPRAPKQVDTDRDGMPDEWEKKHGLDPRDANDRNKLNSEGYTMLEQYLNEKTMERK